MFEIVGVMEFVFFNMFSSKRHLLIAKELTVIKNELEQIGAKTRLKHAWLMFMITFVQCVLVLSFMGPNDYVNNDCIMILAEALCTMPSFQHMILVNSIETMFTALNGHLTIIAVSADQTLQSIVSSRLNSVFHAHSALHVVIDKINSHYWFYYLMRLSCRVFIIV